MVMLGIFASKFIHVFENATERFSSKYHRLVSTSKSTAIKEEERSQDTLSEISSGDEEDVILVLSN